MSRPSLLIIDDDPRFTGQLQAALDGLFHVETGHSEQDFRRLFAVNRYDLLILDMRLDTDMEGLALLKEALAQDPAQAAIVMTAYADMASYADALESGALTYLNKHEFSPSLIARTVEAILQQSRLQKSLVSLERQLDALEPLEIIGAAPAVVRMREHLRRAAEADLPVLLLGEAGSGRELAARNIHRYNRRRAAAPFMRVPCNRLSEAEAVLFGRSSPRPDGSRQESKGALDDAKGGVVLLAGLSALPEEIQTALLHCLQNDGFTRQGGGPAIAWDGQLVASAPDTIGLSAELPAWFEQHGVVVEVPPLRERREDIPLLAPYFLQNVYRQGQSQTRTLTAEALELLENFAWPGNVRELKNALEYAAMRADAENATALAPTHLPAAVSGIQSAPPSALEFDYQLHLARAELALVEQAIDTLATTKKTEIAQALHYNDRFLFTRRLRKSLDKYPQLGREFPRTAGLFSDARSKA